jgi:glycerol-3-phosphate acyltransferase PlsY
VAAILGHNYTPWLGFKGGKGIATSAGVLGALIPWVLVVAWLSWQAIVLTSRRVSLGSVGASLVLPIACSFFYPGQWMKLALAVAACFFGLWRHRSNMERLLKGEEPKVGQHVDPQSEPASKKKN